MTATDTPTSKALEKADNSPRALVGQYRESFTAVLPSHIQKPETWIRLAQGALKKGKRQQDGRTDLEVAAANNPAAFLAALLDCARLGLEPGTEQYYLTPRKVKGRSEILGIVGYQGLIELMYRAGAISSVVAECVYANDRFAFRPGIDEIPLHEIDWDAPDRGALRLVYAFARMKDGATSKVVVLNRAAIDIIKKSSAGADWDSSPWKTNEPAMWLKSAVRQLAKWVPTSSEYIREQLRAARDVAEERAVEPGLGAPDLGPEPDTRGMGDIIDADIIGEDEPEGDDDIADAEIVEPTGTRAAQVVAEAGITVPVDPPEGETPVQRINRVCRAHNIDVAEIVACYSPGDTAPSKVPAANLPDLLQCIDDIEKGAVIWRSATSVAGAHPEYQNGPHTEGVELGDPATWTAEVWRAHGDRVDVRQGALIRQARAIAETVGDDLPGGLDEIAPATAAALAAWLAQQQAGAA